LYIPSTTIRNWKLNYTKPFDNFNKIDEYKKKVLVLIEKGYKIKEVSDLLNLRYNDVRLFLKNKFNKELYEKIKIQPFKLNENSKLINEDLAYIVGVILGDACLTKYQIKLEVIDKDFRDNFAFIVNRWCDIKTGSTERILGNTKRFGCIIYSKDICNFIKQLINDNIFDNISKKEDKIKISFMKGLFDSEGSVNGFSCITFSNINKKIIDFVYNSLKELNFDMGHIKIHRYGRVYQIYI